MTSQKHDEERLRLSEGLFRGIFDHARTGIVITDIADRFLHCNPAYARMLGKSAAELRGVHVSDFVHPDDRVENDALLAQLANRQIDYFETVNRFATPAGETLWVHKYVSLTPDAEGSPPGFLKLITDITDIKNQEMALSASEERFRTLATTLPSLIFVSDAQGNNTYLSPQFQTFVGLEEKDLLGNGWLSVVHPDDREQAGRVWEESWRSGKPYVSEFRMRGANGDWRSFYCRGSPVRNASGAIVQWVGTCTEIQALVDARDELDESRMLLESAKAELERRVFERTAELSNVNLALQKEMQWRESAQAALVQSQKLEAVGQLTSGIAHDFNNILAAIAGGYELIAKRIDDPFVSDIASQCRDAAHRGAKLVKQMLAFARQEILAPRSVDLAALATELQPLIHQAIPGTAVTFDFPPDLPLVIIDPVLLETSLLNLAVNARDAMSGGGDLSIRAFPCPAGQADRPNELGEIDAVAVEVRDNGVGMAPEVLGRVVEPFFTTKPKGKGTGLGLAMVHGFVTQSGGSMRIASDVGTGTAVTLYLPCSGSSSSEVEPTTSEALPINGDARLLLVDDDDAVRTIAAAQLRDLGYYVIEAGDFDEALAVLDSDEPLDCVISDVTMPGRSGIELAAASGERRSDLPLLFLTGHSDDSRLTGKRVVAKPFTAAALTHAIAAALDHE